MKIILLILAFAVVFLLNNLGSNAYAQEIQCPEIDLLSNVDVYSYPGDVECSYYFKMDWDGDGYNEEGTTVIDVFWMLSNDSERNFQSCEEFKQRFFDQYNENIPSTTHYVFVEFRSSWGV
jgi:hypothetical protein